MPSTASPRSRPRRQGGEAGLRRGHRDHQCGERRHGSRGRGTRRRLFRRFRSKSASTLATYSTCCKELTATSCASRWRALRPRPWCATPPTRARSTCSCPCGYERELSLAPEPDADVGPAAPMRSGGWSCATSATIADVALEPRPGPIVLYGENGAGKTNLLEAVSMLSPGRGLRGAKLAEMDRSDGGPLRLGARLDGHQGPVEIETSHDREAERRSALARRPAAARPERAGRACQPALAHAGHGPAVR